MRHLIGQVAGWIYGSAPQISIPAKKCPRQPCGYIVDPILQRGETRHPTAFLQGIRVPFFRREGQQVC
jgi:hypothetical protein